MLETHTLLNSTLVVIQFIAALLGAVYLLKLKNSYWKWFSIYLIIIFIQECFWKFNVSIERQYRVAYYVFFGVPLQYLFLYWLYALKSLKNKNLFFLSVIGYVLAIGVSLFLKNINEVFSISISIGTIILIVLIILEFIKQTNTDNILKFKGNKMFYINIGLILFYVGSYPFHLLGPELHKNHLDIWNMYFTYFLIANCSMYLLFSASFIWGKIH